MSQVKTEGNYSHISVFAIVHSTEDADRIEEAIRNITGSITDLELHPAEGHFGNPMFIVRGHSGGEEAFLSLFDGLETEEFNSLVQTLDDRFDDSSVLHIRFDKQSAYQGRKMLASSLGPAERKVRDTIDFSIKVVTYPSSTANAVAFVRKTLEGYAGVAKPGQRRKA